MSFDLNLIAQYGPDLLRGLMLTLLTWVVGSALGLISGLVLMLLQLSDLPFVRPVIRVYIETVRGTPFLVQLFLAYYGGPVIGIDIPALTLGIACLGIYSSAYFAEIFRAGIAAVPRGQVEAATSLGLTRSTIFIRIVSPQMFIAALPAIVNLVVIVLKETSVLSIITIPELTAQLGGMSSDTFRFFESYAVLALVFWGLTELTSYVGLRLEKAITRHVVYR
ncbi:MAG: amino acid ABC transporter permease [Casimicrobiaceae bacterium]